MPHNKYIDQTHIGGDEAYDVDEGPGGRINSVRPAHVNDQSLGPQFLRARGAGALPGLIDEPVDPIDSLEALVQPAARTLGTIGGGMAAALPISKGLGVLGAAGKRLRPPRPIGPPQGVSISETTTLKPRPPGNALPSEGGSTLPAAKARINRPEREALPPPELEGLPPPGRAGAMRAAAKGKPNIGSEMQDAVRRRVGKWKKERDAE